jgi:hypothetical protein
MVMEISLRTRSSPGRYRAEYSLNQTISIHFLACSDTNSPELDFSSCGPLRGRFTLGDLIRSFCLKVFRIMDDTFDANHVLFYFTRGADEPVLRSLSCQYFRTEGKPPTSEPVVFKAYDRTRPTKPASTSLVTTAETAKTAVTKMITAPTNSNLTASHRLTAVLGR